MTNSTTRPSRAPSFAQSIVGAFHFWGQLRRRKATRRPQTANEAMASDWAKVGQDLQAGMTRFNNEKK